MCWAKNERAVEYREDKDGWMEQKSHLEYPWLFWMDFDEPPKCIRGLKNIPFKAMQ